MLGVLQKLAAVEQLLTTQPDWHGKLVYLQICEPVTSFAQQEAQSDLAASVFEYNLPPSSSILLHSFPSLFLVLTVELQSGWEDQRQIWSRRLCSGGAVQPENQKRGDLCFIHVSNVGGVRTRCEDGAGGKRGSCEKMKRK